MPSESYWKGQLVRTTATFVDKTTNANVDPSGVTCKVKKPDATTSTVTYQASQITKDAVGVYHYDIDTTQVGTWYVQWTSTGVNQAATETSFEVRNSQF